LKKEKRKKAKMQMRVEDDRLHLVCKWCGYQYDGDEKKVRLVGREFEHLCNHNCLICGKLVENLSDKCKGGKGVYHLSCISEFYKDRKICTKHNNYIADFNMFWPVADLRNNWKKFPSEYRAYMLEQYKIIRIATNIPKEIVWMIVERAVYPYGYATNVQNGLIVRDYCIGLCEYSERCRCGEYLKYLDNYSPMCQNGVCCKFSCANCGCSDCGTKCLRLFSELFISKNITPVYDELFALFKDSLKGTDLGTNQISRQMAYLIKTNFYSLPQDIQTKLIHSLFTP